MKLTVPVKAAHDALSVVAAIASGSSTIPILAFAKIVVDGAEIEITTSDLDRQASARAPAKVVTRGAACLPARPLFDIVRNLGKDAELTLSVADSVATVSCGRSRFTLPVLPAQDFPSFEEADDGSTSFSLDASSFGDALECVGVAVSTEETRYYLNGVYVHECDGALRFVATDGHRLIRRDVMPDNRAENVEPAIIPSSTVKHMRRLTGESPKGAKVTLAIGARRVALSVGDARLVSKVVDGTYPDYARVVPAQWQSRFEVEAAPLALAVSRALLGCAQKSRSGALEFADGHLTVSAKDPTDCSSASDEVAAAGDETPVRIGFNLAYLAELVRVIAGDRLVFRLTGPDAPAILIDPADAQTLAVLMPLRI